MKKNTIDIIRKANGISISEKDMKMKVREYLDKLNDSSTRDLAFEDFKILLQTYTDDNSIKAIFPLLLSYSNDASTVIGKEYQIVLIAFALSINYLKNPEYSVLTKIANAITCYLGNYNNVEIQKACSVVMIEIFDQIVRNGENHENAFTFVVKHFLEVIEKNKALVSQPKDNGVMNGGYVIISDIISYVISLNSNEKVEISNNENNMKNQAIDQINRKIERDEIEKASTLNSLQKILEETLYNLINKFISFKYPNPYLIEAMTHLIDVILYDDYKNKIFELIPHLNNVLYNVDAKLYMSKVMICQFYSHLFKKMKKFNKTIENEKEGNETNVEENKNNELNQKDSEEEKIILEIIKALNFATKDRVIKAQVAAEEALLLYNSTNNAQKEDIKNKRKMSKLNLLRNLSKINKEKNIMTSKEVRKEIYNIGMGKFLRSNDYLNNRGEENLLELKKEINKSKSKSREKKDSFNEQRKRGKFKRLSGRNSGGIRIFQRFEEYKDEPNQEENNIEDDKNPNKTWRNGENNIIKSLKDINLNDDLDTIKSNLLKNKDKKESENKENEKEKENNDNQDNKDNQDNDNNIGEDDNKKLNEDNENNENKDIKENDNANEKSKENITFEEEQNNIGDKATLNDFQQQNMNNNLDELKKENMNTINKSKNEEENDKSENNNIMNTNNDIANLSNNDSSNIQGNTIEDINKTNQKMQNDSKRSSVMKSQNNKNVSNSSKSILDKNLLDHLKQNFNDNLDQLTNDFNEKINTKLNNMNNKLLGISQNVGRIKSNLNLMKHTNDLQFRDSKVIIKEENEELNESSMTEKNLGDMAYEKYKSCNILWETIALYLKNEKYDEAYIKALQGGDDIIFLRLIFSVGTWSLPFISVDTNKLILKHFNSIFRTFSLQNKFLEYLESFYNMNMLNVKNFSVEELNDFMQTLYEMKTLQNEVGLRAKTLYNYILKDFSSKNK